MRLLKGTILTLAAAFGIAAAPPAYHYARGNLTFSRLPEGKPTDALMVFTGTSDRIVHGYDLYMNGYSGSMMISGYDYAQALEEPYIKAMAAKSEGGRIFIDDKAENTIQNARNGAKWIKEQGIKSVLLITSGNHMARSYFELRRLVPDSVKIYAEPLKNYQAPPSYDNERTRLACRVYETVSGIPFCYPARSAVREFSL